MINSKWIAKLFICYFYLEHKSLHACHIVVRFVDSKMCSVIINCLQRDNNFKGVTGYGYNIYIKSHYNCDSRRVN